MLTLSSNSRVHITSPQTDDQQQESLFKFTPIFGSEITSLTVIWPVSCSPDEEEENADFNAAIEARNKPGSLPWEQVKKNLGL